MASVINLQETAANLYKTTLEMNESVTKMIGLDAIWCRLLPYDNGEDVIVQEYTLHQYECPKNIKVVTNNSNYNVGNFAIDLFGIKNAETLEINIDITTWNKTYGKDSIPQKGDFVLIPFMHKPYEVISSSAVHTIGEKITFWKCVLGEWKHTASRKESEDFTLSIDELTVSQDRLFGEAISNEIANAVNDEETAYTTTTYVDENKDFDMNSIIVEDVYGKDSNIISFAHYQFENVTKPIVYKNVNATFDPKSKANKWIFSCWFGEGTSTDGSAITLNLISKNTDYWHFSIKAKIKLHKDQKVSINRGNQIILNGEIESDELIEGWTLKIPASSCLKANKKIPQFWDGGFWKIRTKDLYNLFNMYYQNKSILEFGITSDECIDFKYNNTNKQIIATGMNIQGWNYISLELTSTNIKVNLISLFDKKEKIVLQETIPINIKTFEIDKVTISNINTKFAISNIRLFENEYEFGDAYKYDMYSQVVRNASKLILVDTPKAPNNMSFKSPIR